jgi:NADPH-dependent glutamate synthase beta subunit-like oxidoreductase
MVITDRWNKNNLLLVRMILERFKAFNLKGNRRLGKDISLNDAVEKYGHIALCLGAGSPIKPDLAKIRF